MSLDGFKYYIKNPNHIYAFFSSRGLLNWMPDKVYLKMAYRMNMGKKLSLKAPKTFNEKMQWLKLYDRNPLYTTLVDKFGVRKYVAEKLGEEYLIPLVGGPWSAADEIDFENLPKQFVLKCTHDSGGLCICRDKTKFDITVAKKKINRSLGRNYFYNGREWPYKNVEPRVIAEKFMEDMDTNILHEQNEIEKQEHNLVVYKIFNFLGEPKIIQTIQDDKQPSESIDYFDIDWNRLNLRQNFPNSVHSLERPEKLEEMLCLAKKLSEGMAFVRTDFYIINGKVYFSEFTFYSDSGMAKFCPKEWDQILGDWINLPLKNC